jgi:hypothetical protein
MKKLLFVLLFAMLVIVGCTDNSTEPTLQGKSSLKVYLVDSPSTLDSVIIFVNQVEVHKSGSDSTSGWFVINNTPRSYDLLELRNGASAVLGDSVLEPGNYTQIRLILDNGNYVVDNDMRYYLTIPSGFQTGIKLNHEFTLEANNLYELVLDFNVDKSIHVTGNGKYMMKPVIRVIPMIISGTISGQIQQLDAKATVFTTIGEDTVSTYPDVDGFFKLMALRQGTYDVTIFPDTSVYKDSVITGVNVLANRDTYLDIIQLKSK